MARLIFTQQLGRFTTAPQLDTGAATLRAGLECAFAANPLLRGYVLDDQSHLRENVVVFIDGRRCHERQARRSAGARFPVLHTAGTFRRLT